MKKENLTECNGIKVKYAGVLELDGVIEGGTKEAFCEECFKRSGVIFRSGLNDNNRCPAVNKFWLYHFLDIV